MAKVKWNGEIVKVRSTRITGVCADAGHPNQQHDDIIGSRHKDCPGEVRWSEVAKNPLAPCECPCHSEPPHVCPLCDAERATPAQYEEHMKTHTKQDTEQKIKDMLRF